MVDIKKLQKALEIYNKLKESGTFNRDEDSLLFNEYGDETVREILNEIQRSDKVRIFKVEDDLFMVPELDNEIYRYKNEELLRILSLRRNPELFTVQFVWMIILSMFFGEQYEKTGEPRSYIPVDEIYDNVNDAINSFKKKSEGKIEEFTEEFQISLQEIIGKWESLSQITEETKNPGASHTRDYYYIIKALRFWEEERIVTVYEDEEVRLTEKGRTIPEHYYHREETINKMHDLIERAKNEQELNGKKEGVNDEEDEEQELVV